MEVILRLLKDADEVRALAPELDRYAREVTAEFRDDDLPEGVSERMIDRHAGAREWVVVAAYTDGDEGRVGICITAPLEDPLTLERIPLVVLLHVHRAYRHRGLARHLIEAATTELGERGIGLLGARAGHNDDALISMGERWGFVRHWELMLRE